MARTVEERERMARPFLERSKRRVDEGVPGAIAEAIWDCATFGAPMPSWLAEIVIHAYVTGKWNEVLHRPKKRGPPEAKDKFEKAFDVFAAVNGRLRAGDK